MRAFVLVLAVLAPLGTAPGAVSAQVGPPPPPGSWELQQNDPNPFCSDPGATRIQFLVPQPAHVELAVLQPGGGAVLRTLVDAMLAAGVFAVVWDGAGANGVPLPDGVYPYRMRATDAASNMLFEATKTAVVACNVGVQRGVWGQVKGRYR